MILPRTSIVAMMLPASAGAGSPSRAAAAAHTAVAKDSAAVDCASLPTEMASRWPDPSTSIVSASWVPAGPQALSVQPGSRSIDVPAHCELIGVLRNRVGADGQHYAIRFHLRLPHGWSGRFFFQGGGGSNGVLGDALGVYSSLVPPALAQRYAVVSQDSGHDNQLNSDPARGGVLAFGFDAIARADYGHASLR